MAKSKTNLAGILSFSKEMAYLQEHDVFLSQKDGYYNNQYRVLFSFLGMKDDFTKQIHNIANTTQRVFSKEDYVNELHYSDELDFIAFRQVVMDLYSLAVSSHRDGGLGRWFMVNGYKEESFGDVLAKYEKIVKAFPNEAVRNLALWMLQKEWELRGSYEYSPDKVPSQGNENSHLELGYQVLYLWREFLKMLEEQKQQQEQGDGGSSQNSKDKKQEQQKQEQNKSNSQNSSLSTGTGTLKSESKPSSGKNEQQKQESKPEQEQKDKQEQQKEQEQKKEEDEAKDKEQKERESKPEQEEDRGEQDKESDADKNEEADDNEPDSEDESDDDIDEEPDEIGGREKGTGHENPRGDNKFDIEKWQDFIKNLAHNYPAENKARSAAKQGINKKEQIRIEPQIAAAIRQFCKQIRNRETSKVRTIESQVGLKFNTFRAVQFLATRNPIIKCFDKTSVARSTAIDMVFGLDISGSMGNNVTNKEKLVTSLISTINSSLVKHVKIFATSTDTESIYDSRENNTLSLNRRILSAMRKMRGGGGTDLATCIPYVLDYCNPRTRTEFIMITDGYDQDIQNLILKLGAMTQKNYFLRAHMVIVNNGYDSHIINNLPGVIKKLSSKEKFEIIDARFIGQPTLQELEQYRNNDSLSKLMNTAMKQLNI